MCYCCYYKLLLSEQPDWEFLATQVVIVLRRAKDKPSDVHGFYPDTQMQGNWQPRF